MKVCLQCSKPLRELSVLSLLLCKELGLLLLLLRQECRRQMLQLPLQHFHAAPQFPLTATLAIPLPCRLLLLLLVQLEHLVLYCLLRLQLCLLTQVCFD